MNIEHNEIRMAFYALKATKKLMEIELEAKRGKVPAENFERAEEELAGLTAFLDKITLENAKLVSINPFTCYPKLFYPNITDNLK